MINQPWTSSLDRTLFPPPHETLLRDHFQASIARWMKAASEEYDEEDSFEDQDEISEWTEISDDRCLIAADFSRDIVFPQPGSKGEERIDASALQLGTQV